MKKQIKTWKLLLPAALLAAFAMMATACSADAGKAAAEMKAADKDVSGVVTTKIDLSAYDEGSVVRAWIPVASDGDYQKISDVEFDAGDGASRVELTEDSMGNKMLYVEWAADADPFDRKASVSFHADRKVANADPDKIVEEGEIPAEIAEKYLKPSAMVASDDPEIIALAEEITSGQDTVVGKARAIYDWIYENMDRDDNVTGCGDGDVCRLVDKGVLAGKCTDIGSVYVALLRASGVPAREEFGVRMNEPTITKNQHCWVEFYVPGTGWIPTDVADVLKFVLKEECEKDSDVALAKKEYWWGHWEAERVGLSQERDLVLEPAQEAGPLNNFGYPYAEVDGRPLDYYHPDTFIYSISFKDDAGEKE